MLTATTHTPRLNTLTSETRWYFLSVDQIEQVSQLLAPRGLLAEIHQGVDGRTSVRFSYLPQTSRDHVAILGFVDGVVATVTRPLS